MGRKPSIDQATGARLFAAYQRLGTKAAAAAEIGVSESAARRYLDALPVAATPVIASQRQIIETAGAALFDTRRALEENYGRVLQLVQQLEVGIVEVKRGALGEYEARVSPGVLLAALREVREHIQSGMKFQQLLLDMDEVRTFQQAVVEAIGEADEPTKQRILERLRQRRAVDFAL